MEGSSEASERRDPALVAPMRKMVAGVTVFAGYGAVI